MNFLMPSSAGVQVEIALGERVVHRLSGRSRGGHGLHDVVEHRGLISAERRSDHRGELRAA
jgi:hypothetical protein